MEEKEKEKEKAKEKEEEEEEEEGEEGERSEASDATRGDVCYYAATRCEAGDILSVQLFGISCSPCVDPRGTSSLARRVKCSMKAGAKERKKGEQGREMKRRKEEKMFHEDEGGLAK